MSLSSERNVYDFSDDFNSPTNVTFKSASKHKDQEQILKHSKCDFIDNTISFTFQEKVDTAEIRFSALLMENRLLPPKTS